MLVNYNNSETQHQEPAFSERKRTSCICQRRTDDKVPCMPDMSKTCPCKIQQRKKLQHKNHINIRHMIKAHYKRTPTVSDFIRQYNCSEGGLELYMVYRMHDCKGRKIIIYINCHNTPFLVFRGFDLNCVTKWKIITTTGDFRKEGIVMTQTLNLNTLNGKKPCSCCCKWMKEFLLPALLLAGINDTLWLRCVLQCYWLQARTCF